MSKYFITVIGHFGNGKNLLNGQTVKTKIITDELERQLGSDSIQRIDTHGGAKTLFKAPFQIFRALKSSKNVIILPAHNGLRVNAPLLSFGKHFFKGRKLHYIVIGGWLPEFIKNRKTLAKSLKKFDGIYVETNTMKTALERDGFSNVSVMPNCKNLNILSENELVYPEGMPYKLCTFSRVMKEKGIEDAVNAVKEINEESGKTVYTLDIYGQVDSNQTEWFEELQKSFPEYVKYGGLVPFDKSTEVLKYYFALLFPTHFYTEGIPGTIIDAYASGLPVISAKWESFDDIIRAGVTGIGYKFDNMNELKKTLKNVALNSDILDSMKSNCLDEAKKYLPENAISKIIF